MRVSTGPRATPPQATPQTRPHGLEFQQAEVLRRGGELERAAPAVLIVVRRLPRQARAPAQRVGAGPEQERDPLLVPLPAVVPQGDVGLLLERGVGGTQPNASEDLRGFV